MNKNDKQKTESLEERKEKEFMDKFTHQQAGHEFILVGNSAHPHFVWEWIQQALKDQRESMLDILEGRDVTGIYCGIEDNKITDRYEAALYGYQEAIRILELEIDNL